MRHRNSLRARQATQHARLGTRRARRQLSLERLEPRVVLSGTSAPIDADPFAAAEPDNHGALGAMTLARAEGEGATDAATLGAAQA
ncbi:MAG: hypothetical protein FJ276_33265, partial [Planctomycetes bacterium]|nr:hypothetical protein [Planctomycetota bacterium]